MIEIAKRSPNQIDRNMNPLSQLGLCILMDIIGAMTYLLPGVGELADIVYAPIQGAVAWTMFGGERWGTVWTIVAVSEELLPFVDVFPSMTLGWVMKFML